MHATLTAPLLAATVVSFPQAPQRIAPQVVLSSGTALAAALYASDMPNTYRASSKDAAQIETWITQGIERLGLDEAYRRGRFLRHFNLLMIEGKDGPDVRAAYRQYFPRARRIDRAQDAAAALAVRSLNIAGAAHEGPVAA
ncbi:hypothetical protein ABZW03_29865 [Kitasatospora sp. NPDC004799]|uniref:hypothetical protein n=1 Tax=Kitasatospora sp. NPDC004799 TaxID=3154460 RepID=UPI0033BAA546